MVVYYPTLYTTPNPQKVQKTQFSQIAGGFLLFWSKIFKKIFERSLDELFFAEKNLLQHIQYFAQNRILGTKVQQFSTKIGILA